MKKVFDSIIDKLEDLHAEFINQYGVVGSNHRASAVSRCIRIVEEVQEEYNGGWISCSERLPESGKSVIVSYKDRFLTQADGTCEGWYDATNMIWHLTDYEYSNNVEVIAWRERLAPYQPKGE